MNPYNFTKLYRFYKGSKPTDWFYAITEDGKEHLTSDWSTYDGLPTFSRNTEIGQTWSFHDKRQLQIVKIEWSDTWHEVKKYKILYDQTHYSI
jgi:hypothetical protein